MKYMFNLTNKLILAAAFVNFALTGINATTPITYTDITTRKEFTAANQKSAIFTTVGKPYMIKIIPSLSEFTTIFCGWYDQETNDVYKHEENSDLEKIIPTRKTQKYVNTNVKIDRVLQGYRETYAEQFIEGLLRAIKLYPHLTYDGTFLVDEYLEKFPMSWTFDNIDEFRAIKTYLKQKFAEKQITPLEEKPLLLIDFVQQNQSFNDDDITFLTTYYALLDGNDKNVKKFFKDLKTARYDEREKTDNAKPILESSGEMFIRFAEDKIGSLKTKDLIVKFILFGGMCWAGVELWTLLTDREKSKFSKLFSSTPASTPTVAGAATATAH